MKVFVFDLLAYGKHFDQYKQTKYLPYPLGTDHYDREVAAETYEQHLQVWEEMDKLGFDGVGLNEHHTTPHGLMNSPNMMAAVAAQRTKKLKFLMLGNLVPLHNPLRIAEELAMADTMSRGRILSGFARGVPREYNVYGVPMSESRARFEEAVDIMMRVGTVSLLLKATPPPAEAPVPVSVGNRRPRVHATTARKQIGPRQCLSAGSLPE